MNYRTIGQVACHKPLATLGMEELAARQSTLKPSGGVLFARNADREEKSEARQHVVDLFHPIRWGEGRRLHMLTMPGVHWRFERLLLATREEGWMRAPKPRNTWFTGIENDRALYFASVAQMPGLNTPNAITKRSALPFAEMGVKTRYASFFFANIDDLMKQTTWNDGWDAAWLDFTGPLTIERVGLIEPFYQKYIKDTLVITALKARWNQATSTAIEHAGSHSEWLLQYLEGEVLHNVEYNNDASSMAQLAIRKFTPVISNDGDEQMSLQGNEMRSVRQGAKLQSYHKENPRDVLLRLHRDHPASSAGALTKLFFKEIEDDPDRDGYINTIVEYWARNTLTSITSQNGKTRGVQHVVRNAKSSTVADAVAQAKQRVVQRLLTLVMPNGKLLGECTGAECLRMGSEQTLLGKRLIKIGHKVGTRQRVENALDEDDLKAIWK